jgi:SAM-dependent methyltransferase
MQRITHRQQQKRWDEEHRKPSVLLQMDSVEPSSGVVKFYEWLVTRGAGNGLKGLEMCCGKGRNVIWLANQGVAMTGVDFSAFAIAEAKKRAKDIATAHFTVHDVTLPYLLQAGSLDFVIDCFGSTDIESVEGRVAARDNLIKILKPGGYYLTYLLSTDDEFHKMMIARHPGPEPGSFVHPVNGKFEKAFTEAEVREFYKDLKLVTLARLPKTATFEGKPYACNHIWAIFQVSRPS